MQLGFTEKEAMTYIMLLRVGPCPASSLAKRLCLKRVTVYTVLNSLHDRGIINYVIDGKIRHYLAHRPETILNNLVREQMDIAFRIKIAKNCIANLRSYSLNG